MTLAERVAELDLAALPDWQVAEILNSPDSSLPEIIVLESTIVGPGKIMDALGSVLGASFLNSLELMAQTNEVIRWAMYVLKSSGLDMANATVRSNLDDLVGEGALTAAQAASLKGLAERRRFPSWAEHHNIVVTARTVGIARGAME